MVKIAYARTEPEAEMLQGLLAEADIPSLLKRSGGFDNPEFLPNGPRDIYVSQVHAKRAREVLADVLIEDESDERAALEEERRLARGETRLTSPAQLAFWIVIVVLAGCGVAWMLYQVG